MKQQPAVSFIICTYNRASYLDDTLSGLIKFGAPDFYYELLVIDNNSNDRTPEVVKQHRESVSGDHVLIRYLKETSQGLSHARNRGVKEAKAKHVVFFDDDIKATPSLIPAWCTFFTDFPQAKAAGGKINVKFDASRPKWMSHFLLPLLGHHDLGRSQKTYPKTKYPFGGNMGFAKSVFKKVGFFDTELGRKGKELHAAEEKEVFRRLRDISIPIHYLPDAFLYHRVDKSRLTKEYIRKQALGIGQSMKLQLRDASSIKKAKSRLMELTKLLATIPISIGYLLMLQPSKAETLFQFRSWIREGYKTPIKRGAES